MKGGKDDVKGGWDETGLLNMASLQGPVGPARKLGEETLPGFSGNGEAFEVCVPE